MDELSPTHTPAESLQLIAETLAAMPWESATTEDYEVVREFRNTLYDVTDRIDSVIEELAQELTRQEVARERDDRTDTPRTSGRADLRIVR